MARRKEANARIFLSDGTALNVRIMDSLLVDDLIVQGAKAEGYRVITGRDVFPTNGRKIKDYLLRIGSIPE